MGQPRSLLVGDKIEEYDIIVATGFTPEVLPHRALVRPGTGVVDAHPMDSRNKNGRYDSSSACDANRSQDTRKSPAPFHETVCG